MKMSVIVLMISACNTSFGMMPYYKPSRKAKLKNSPEMKVARRKAFSRMQQDLENQRNNIKLIEPRPSEDCALENVPLPLEILLKIGESGKNVIDKLDATCRLMNRHLVHKKIKNARGLCEGNMLLILHG